MKMHVVLLVGLYLVSICAAQAKCQGQVVTVMAGKTKLAQWSADSDEIHRLKLPDGTKFGVQIDPAPKDRTAVWRRANKDSKAELLRIRILDLEGSKQEVITTNYGPVNSQHAFGADGGANKVRVLGRPGINVILAKKYCSE